MELKGGNSLNGHEALSPADTDVLQIVSKSVTHKDEKYEIVFQGRKENNLIVSTVWL